MQMNYSKDQACLELKDLINSWLSEKDSRNIAALARGAGVGENCIRRILNSNSMPVTENLHKIVVFIKGDDKHQNLLSSLSTNLKNHIKFELSYLNFDELKDYKSMAAFEEHLSDYSTQFIFERSSMGSGISFEEIKNLFGEIGLSKINTLIELNLVSNNNGIILVNKDYQYHTWSTSLYKKFIPETIKNFYKTESQINYLFNVNEGVSTKGYARIMDVLENAYKQIQDIANNEKGEIPVAVAGFMDTLSNNDYFSNKKGS